MNDLIHPIPKRVIWCYNQESSIQNVPKNLVNIFHKGVPEDFEALSSQCSSSGSINSSNNEQSFEQDDGSNFDHTLVVLDDLMSECSNSKNKENVLDLFTRVGHHQNLSCILTLQNFFHKNLRGLTLNCKYLLFLKNPRCTDSIAVLGRQLNHGKRHPCLELAYNEACCKPYGHVFLDMSQKCNDEYRIRNSIFPNNATVYCKR